MKKSEFSFSYPEELIAQVPSDKRGASRLLVADRHTKSISHQQFSDILNYVEPGDCLVVNDTKVLASRIFGQKESGGKVELILLKSLGKGIWEAIGRASTKFKRS